MIDKLQTVFWFLKQPKGVQLLANLILQKTIYKHKELTKDESIKWCASVVVDTDKALKGLFPDNDVNFVEVDKQFSDAFDYANQKVTQTPFKMGGAGNLNLLYNISEIIQAKYVAETGVAYGWSSLSILLSLVKRSDSLLVSTDMPYAKMGNENFVGIVVNPSLKSNWMLIQESDISGLPKGLSKVPYLDIVHYDSDKSYVGRMKSYPILFDKLRKGGVFISDDIQDNLGFKDYCAKMNIKPIVVSFEEKYVGVFIKN